MARFTVKVKYTMDKEIHVYADDEAAAEEQACGIVDQWKGVLETEAVETREE